MSPKPHRESVSGVFYLQQQQCCSCLRHKLDTLHHVPILSQVMICHRQTDWHFAGLSKLHVVWPTNCRNES